MADKSQGRERAYIVISTTLEDAKKYEGCKVVPYGEIYPAIYRQVYGPASKRDCEKWAASHCDKKATA